LALKFTKNHYSPLPTCCEVKPCLRTGGSGLFAKENIPGGSKLGVTHVSVTNQGQMDLVGAGVVRTPLGGFLNHSDTPNAVVMPVGNIARILWSVRPIPAGQEITSYYTSGYEDIIPNFGGAKDLS
jgi:hypothetical protein